MCIRDIIVAVTVTVVACALLILFRGTRLGLSIRATGDNPEMVLASSINTAFTITGYIFSVSGALAHNCGQLLGAAALLSDKMAITYAPVSYTHLIPKKKAPWKGQTACQAGRFVWLCSSARGIPPLFYGNTA